MPWKMIETNFSLRYLTKVSFNTYTYFSCFRIQFFLEKNDQKLELGVYFWFLRLKTQRETRKKGEALAF